MLTKLFFRQFARQIRRSQFLNQFKKENIQEFKDQDIFSDQFESSKNLVQEQQKIQENTETKELIEQENEQMTQQELEFVRETLLYQGEDQYPDKLVNRPEKQVVWGLGGELLKLQKQKFRKNKNPTVDEVVSFLELEQCKDISVVDMRELEWICLIIVQQLQLIVKIMDLKLEKIQQEQLKIFKLKNFYINLNYMEEEMMDVCLKEINVNLQTEETRNEINLEHKWRNPVSEEEIIEMEKLTMKKKKKAIYQPLDD